MIILGIDPGTAITGWAVIEALSEPKALEYGVITTSSRAVLPKRLYHIYTSIKKIIHQYQPNVFAVEQIFFSNNAKTAIAVGQARGVVLCAGAEHNLDVFEYTPLQVKQSVAGYGKADKKQMQKMVTNIFKLDVIPTPDDAADALAIALCHQYRDKWNKIIEKSK